MTTRNFKDLVVWQKAQNLAVEVYMSFEGNRDFGFKDQVQRAAVSIPNNIAEGYARRSDKAFKNFLAIAKGSTAELESMLNLAVRLGYISNKSQRNLLSEVNQVTRLLSAFIKKI